MKYKLLSSYSYSYENKEKYSEEYNSRYNSPAAIRLEFDIKGNPAFVLTTPEICGLIAEIYKMNNKIGNLRRKLPGVAISLYEKSCLVDEIMNTNGIEGIRSTRKEIEDVIPDIEKGENSSKRFNCIVRKYFMLMDKATHEEIKKPEDIRKIYDGLILADLDKSNFPDGILFRRESVSVLSPTQKEKHTGVFPEEKIILSLDSALNILNDSNIETMIRISLFHYMFGYIHPFYDGNGRTARFISSISLAENLSPLVAYRLSYSINNNKHDYYKAFDICNDKKNKGDLTNFVTMFLNMIRESENHLYEYLKDKTIQLEHYSSLIGKLNKKYAEIIYILIQNELFNDEPIDRKTIASAANLSYLTVKKELEKMISEGLPIEESKFVRLFVYSIDLDELEIYLEKIQIDKQN